ncbi:MAG: hypothetical protein QOG53_505 [Frankiales bacterium]|jgi:uncharacterized RDD family membrane protein YckC|nr:hypothetical protein [Frankiales bacterium]
MTYADGVQPASVGARVVAALIDLVPTLALFFLLAKTVGTWETGGGQTRIELHNGAALLYVVLVLAYYLFFELLFSRTPGKMARGLVVVDVNGSKARPSQMVGRNLMRIVDFAPAFYLIGFVAVIANDRNARLGDLAAKTAVVQGR